MEEPQPLPQILSPCSSGRRSINSPEFEFWTSFPPPNLISADELFADGFLLPLHHLPPPQDPPETSLPESEPEILHELPNSNPSNSAPTTNSKRWRHIFKKNGKKSLDSSAISSNGADDQCNNSKEKDASFNKEKRRERKNGGSFGAGIGGGVVSAAELNINIWPFSRSRSAGNGGARPRTAAARKVSSAPCSRSNSTGESKSKKWPNSPNRAGVHLGRSSPVWQVRRGGVGRSSEAAAKIAEKGFKKDGNECRRKTPAAVGGGGGAKARVLSLNVPMCIGYRPHLSCKTDDNSAVNIGGGGGGQLGVSGEGVRRGHLFNIKSLFTKKVY